MGDERENHYLVCCSHGKDGSLPLPQPVGVALAHTIEINLDLKVEVADVASVWLQFSVGGATTVVVVFILSY